MCAQYIIKGNLRDLEKKFGLLVPDELESEIEQRVMPYQPGLVVLHGENQLQLATMSYSLVPSWAKEAKVKFATHNARVETIADKPTWKRPLVSQRCVVPLSQFIEPIYHNEHAGHMVRFYQQSGEFLMAAGLWDHWQDPSGKISFDSYAIITEEANAFVAQVGHDRTPIFLNAQGVKDWLHPEIREAKELLALLKSQPPTVNWAVERDRPMRPGWEKRA